MTTHLNNPLVIEALKAFGNLIAARRQSSRWTPHDIWQKTGVLPSVVSAVEIGDDWPTDGDREALCEFLGIPVDTLGKMIRQAIAPRVLPSPDEEQSPTTSNVVILKDFKQKNGQGIPRKGA